MNSGSDLNYFLNVSTHGPDFVVWRSDLVANDRHIIEAPTGCYFVLILLEKIR